MVGNKYISKKYIVFVQSLSCGLHFATPWIVAHQAPLFMGFPRQEYWSGLLFPSPGELLNPGINPRLLLGRQILYQSHLGIILT